tara:strand:+ start:290 stop:472 length:183 start_codon:yes stop_codon:yes gene_type:complete
MKKELMEILACPVCKEPLRLAVTEEKDSDVVSGSLHCTVCLQDYPIENSIPNMLPPDIDE